MMRAGHPRGKRGTIGLALASALGFLIVLSFLSFVQLRSTSEALHMATRDAGGAVVEELALSAVDEAGWRLERLITGATSGPKLTRALILARTGSLDLTRDLYPNTLEDELDSSPHPLHRSASIELFQALMTVPPPGSRGEQQIVEFDCAVRLRLGHAEIYRRVLERRHYGVSFAAQLPPVAHHPLVILDHQAALLAIQREQLHLGAAIGDFQRAARTLNGFLLSIGGGRVSPLPFIGFRKVVGAPAGASVICVPSDYALMPGARSMVVGPSIDPALVSGFPGARTRVVACTADRVDLAAMDYEVRLREQYEPVASHLESRVRSYNDFVRSRATSYCEVRPDSPTRRSLLSSWSGALRPVLEEMMAANKALNRITRHCAGHRTSDLTPDAVEAYLATASQRLVPVSRQVKDPKELEAFFQEYPSYSGLLEWEGGPAAVRAAGRKGHLVISAAATVRFDELSVGSGQSDLVLVNAEEVALGGGRVSAGLVTRDRFRPDRTSIHGNLVLMRLRPLAERSREEELSGDVRFDPRLDGGGPWIAKGDPDETPDGPRERNPVALDHYTVALSPRVTQRVMLRSRAEEEAR